MIGQKFNIPKYDWDVEVYYCVQKDDIDFCLNKLKRLTSKQKYFKECKSTLYNDKKDRAYIYSSMSVKSTVIFIGEHSSTGELLNTIAHEANHLKAHIASYYNLDEKDEEVCYVIGTIVKQMSNIFIKFICTKYLQF